MIISEAISILKIHQQWRLGADIVMSEPKELTEALDVLLNHCTDTTEISDEEIEDVAWERYTGDSARLAWVAAIKWYREQLKSKQ